MPKKEIMSSDDSEDSDTDFTDSDWRSLDLNLYDWILNVSCKNKKTYQTVRFNREFIHDVWCYNRYIYLVGRVFVLWIRLVSFLTSFCLLVHFFGLRFSIFQNYFAIEESAFYVFDRVFAMDFSRRSSGSKINIFNFETSDRTQGTPIGQWTTVQVSLCVVIVFEKSRSKSYLVTRISKWRLFLWHF